MDALVKTIERITGSIGILASLLIVPLVLATCYEVFARYVFGAPTIWAYEAGYFLTGSHFLLGFAYTLAAGAHIRIDIFSEKFSPRMRATIDLLAYAVMLPLLVWLSYALFHHLSIGYLRGERTGQSAWNPPVWPFRIVFFAAFALLALQVLAELAKTLRTLRTGAR